MDNWVVSFLPVFFGYVELISNTPAREYSRALEELIFTHFAIIVVPCNNFGENDSHHLMMIFRRHGAIV